MLKNNNERKQWIENETLLEQTCISDIVSRMAKMK